MGLVNQKLILAGLFIFSCFVSWAVITGPVNQTGTTFSANPGNVTITAPGAGNCLIAQIGESVTTDSFTSITGGGVTWVFGKRSAVNRDSEIWYGINSSGVGTTIAFNHT